MNKSSWFVEVISSVLHCHHNLPLIPRDDRLTGALPVRHVSTVVQRTQEIVRKIPDPVAEALILPEGAEEAEGGTIFSERAKA